uniref:Phosphatidylinositol glycan anchor biosynthesis class F n=1 Tax=Pavo cristatus TaxID=9049 RepID=A0A8C9GA73_PAVCR
MKEAELRRLLAANLLCAVSIVLTALVPALFLDGFSVLGTHLTWLCVCSVCVSVLSISLCLILKPSPSSKRSSLSNKVRFVGIKGVRCFVFQCRVLHLGYPGSTLRHFMSTNLLIQILFKTALNLAMSIWENSLQITTMCSILGGWFGAFPIPLDWDRPWQVWPISCSLGATFGYMAGLIIAPLWIHWNRKQLTYKSR